MRKYTKTVGALAAASALVAGNAMAEIEGEIHVGYANMYEFRFVDLGQDMVEAGVDLSLGEYSGFSFAAGAWYASTNDSKSSIIGQNLNANELDLYASVGYECGPVSLEAGYIFYHFLDVAGIDTQEVYLAASTELFWGIGAGATFFYDFDANNGWYLQPEITKSFEFSECLSLDLAVGCGIADGHGLQVDTSAPFFNPGATADGYQGYYVSAALPWEFRDGVTLTPYVKYTDGDSDLLTNLTDVTSGQDYLIAGVKLAVSF
ncbi:hypothetical protein [Luteolibacter marinus]|uniref:hypothetical protein n=1 Tax=Luteolibacter marinus TaxID=2776705 RepID=UPI0018687673|nr:hypothetical protein [Luteolibacter marinus]